MKAARLSSAFTTHSALPSSPPQLSACQTSRAHAVIITTFNNDAVQPSVATVNLESITGTTTPVHIRASRKDKHLHSLDWLSRLAKLSRVLSGVIRLPSLEPFDMSYSSVPATPRVISPSPTPSESRSDIDDGYFGPVTRSARKKAAAQAQAPIDESVDEDGDDEKSDLRRPRSTSRSPMRKRKLAGLTSAQATTPAVQLPPIKENGMVTDGHLSPTSARSNGWSWRDISRSPSPLGLIPIHRHWRVFVHRHEVPRKLLHVSIGFFTIWLFVTGVQTRSITPYLMAALIPITTTDWLRHTYPSLNRLYVRVLGALMRETEFDGWNGVIWYLLGAWIVLGFFPKDVGVMGVLLLSWCDTAASTIGRAYGRYTPRIRRGKSLAGSLGAFAVGVATAALFWGYLAPRTGPFVDDDKFPFMFTGALRLPTAVRDVFGLTETQGSITGTLALGVVSLWTGLIASASEVVDIFGWDDNLTIPVLSGLGLWGFLKSFG